MDYEIKCTISIKIQEDDLNISRLIKAVQDFSKFVLAPQFLIMIIEAIDHYLLSILRSKSPKQYENRGYQKRQLQTSMGKLDLRFLKVKDLKTGLVNCPAKKLLGISNYIQWSHETLVNCSGLLPFMSYRRSSLEFIEQHGYGPSKSVIHNRLAELVGTGEYQPDLKDKEYRYLLIDGTKAKFQDRSKETAAEIFYQGEVRFAYASIGEGKPFELVGLWVNKSWRECSKELFGRLETDTLKVLICDGEESIAKAFLQPTMRLQRCQWHGARELKYILYADGVKKKEQFPILSDLENIQMVGSRQETFEKLTEKDNTSLINIRDKIVSDIQDLAENTIGKGYVKAGTYLQNLAEPFVTCLDYYLETGKHIPITSNIIERQIGLFKNRYSRVGRRWSEGGLLRWFAIAIRKLLPQFDWKKCWDDLLGAKDAVSLCLQTCLIT